MGQDRFLGADRWSPARRRTVTLAAMCAAQFMIMLDVTIVNIALPSMQRDLGMSAGGLEWVVSAYALALAALIPFGGALGDRYGRKRWFLVGMVIFTAGSVACALSPNAGTLIAFRGVQGAGGALMAALTLSILTQAYPPKARAHAIGTWGAIGGLGFGVGPVVGGLLLSVFGWSSVFWVNIPVAVVGLALAIAAVHESAPVAGRRLDIPGAITSAAGLLGVTFGFIESSSHSWGSSIVAGPLAAGAVLLVLFGWVESRVAQPMAPLGLLRSRRLSAGIVLYLANYVALTSVMFYMTLIYQDVDGWSVLRTGLSWLIMNGPFVIVASLAGRLNRRFGAAVTVTAGALAFGAATLVLAQVTITTPFILTVIGFILVGAGAGALVPGTTHAAMSEVPPTVSGVASGLLNAGRQIGTAIGLAVLGTIGARAATSSWSAATRSFPASLRGAAAGQTQNVAGGRVQAVTGALGGSYRDAAVHSFLSGSHLALTIAGCLLLAASIVSATRFRVSRASTAAVPQTEAPAEPIR
jgi:DHA2 family methylenomycin A resistance protein-like MFS transporter